MMMIDLLSVEGMRKSDAGAIAAGTPGRELMARAGKAIFDACDWTPPVAIVCGKGNNGGDGYALALLLAAGGIALQLFVQEEPATPDALWFYQECQRQNLPMTSWQEVSALQDYSTVVDCIFGTGFRGVAAGESARMIRLINNSGAFVISADINSGLNGDNGLGTTAVRSDLTVSIGSFQPGHFLAQAKDRIGRKTNADIGIPPAVPAYHLIDQEDVAPLFPPRKHFSNKGSYGYPVLIGGSLPYSGAIRLAAMANAAMRTGCGIARVATPRSLCPLVASAVLESTLIPLPEKESSLLFEEAAFRNLSEKAPAIAFGMGLGHTPETEKALSFLLREYAGILIVDADGLNALAALGAERLDEAPCKIILTPHPGEFARLTGRSIPEVLSEPIPLARSFAADHHVILLLKGASTVITDGNAVYLTDRGCPGMATAGSGDVLSGILAALCAIPRNDLLLTVAGGAWLNGCAGEKAEKRVGPVSMVASDTIQAIPETIHTLTAHR